VKARWKVLSTLGAVGILSVSALFGCSEAGPPLLRHVTAGGGWTGACPPEGASEAQLRASLPLAISPELNQRLAQSFPPGTPEERLVKSLTEQGFKLLPSCRNNPSIRVAVFNGYAGGIFNTWASVYWKVDGASAIVWTKGFVQFDGL
jgi:hypothetical protein